MFKDSKLVIAPKNFHFLRWEIEEFKKHFKAVIQTKNPSRWLEEEDVLLTCATPSFLKFQNLKCRAKFGILYASMKLRPQHPSFKERKAYRVICEAATKYNAVFGHNGPVWEAFKDSCPNFFLHRYSAADSLFKKTRTREEFKRVIHLAREASFKGRHISEAVMPLLPYDGEVLPSKSDLQDPSNHYVKAKTGYVLDWKKDLPSIYQAADGFLSPSVIGPPPKYDVDGKYTQATLEAGLSGCIIFWNDCMNLGNCFDTVFKLPSENPKEIAEFIQSTIKNLDTEEHSQKTAKEFYEKCNAAESVKAKVDIMKQTLK